MATTATVSISSDIAPGFGGISESMTLTQAGTLTDIDSTSGFQIRKLSATAAVDLITMTAEIVEPKDSVAAKIFIRNIGHKGVIDKSVGVTIGVKFIYNNIKSILLTNVHATADATVTLFIQDDPVSGTTRTFNIIHTIAIPADSSLFLDNPSMFLFGREFGLYITVGSSDTVDIIVNQ